MFEPDDALAVLERTPQHLPAFEPNLEVVTRRAQRRKVRRLSLQSVVGGLVAAGVVLPLLALTGVIGGRSTVMPGAGGAPQRLVRWYEPSESMDPTIKVGETVLVDTNAYADGRLPRTGDLVLFRFTDAGQRFESVKRVIGLPGQTVEIHGGVVFVDGRRLDEPYLHGHEDPADYGPFLVQADRVFVAGDNRINSNDSRHAMGQIPIADLLGEVVGRSDEPGQPQLPATEAGPPTGT